ncbi:unnamed protein product, partial [Heligmosomoides polygyrus]
MQSPSCSRQFFADGRKPLFTWWVTSVQVIVCIVSLLFYGLGPTGWERVEMTEEVIDVTLAMRQVSYFEPVNLWIGPRFADLIRLGAKYSPCMRREPGLWKLIGEERKKENATGCCVFNDGTGCYQTGQTSCPRVLATWHKWTKRKPSKSDSFLLDNLKEVGSVSPAVSTHAWRTAGAVCGQDPDFCIRPSSVRPYEWPDDLSRWPVCEQPRQGPFLPIHMTCQVTGRPCCIQMQGQCRIATREYCTFVKGHFHENATLCSQVNCFSDICGMLPFVRRDYPDQFYRMFFSLFLHAGVIHVAFTVFVQMWLMLDLEMLIGWKRMAILYIGSGIGGNIASAIFVPYSVSPHLRTIPLAPHGQKWAKKRQHSVAKSRLIITPSVLGLLKKGWHHSICLFEIYTNMCKTLPEHPYFRRGWSK